MTREDLEAVRAMCVARGWPPSMTEDDDTVLALAALLADGAEPLDLRRFGLLAVGKAWCSTWARGAEDAVARLEAAWEADDNDRALVAAHDALSAVDRLVGWARTLAKVCDDDTYQQHVADFEARHPELRTARNFHEHLPGYLT